MTALDGNVHDRLDTLQRRVNDLAMRMPNPPVAIGMPGQKRQVRIAKTVAEDGEYPTSGKRVPIVFVDLSIVSESTISPTDRDSKAQAYAYNLGEGNNGSFLPPENTLIIITLANGKWRLDYRPNDTFDRCRAIVKGAFDGGDATFIVDNVRPSRGASPVESSSEELTVRNTFKWSADDNAVCFIEYNNDDEQWHAYQVECPL